MPRAAGAQWTLGVLIGVPLLALFVLICLVIIVVGLQSLTTRGYYRERFPGLRTAGITFVVMVVVLITALVAYWPLKAEYHQYRSVSGVVAKISSRLIAVGDSDHAGTDQKFVVVLTSGPQQYGVNDTRAALVKPGDEIHLRCKRSYEYGSDNAGYDCKWSR